MRKKLLLISSVLSIAVVAHLYAGGTSDGKDKAPKNFSKLESEVRNLPDSLFSPVEIEDLLDDEVYLKLAHEGWSSEEITQIMSTALKDKSKVRGKIGYELYAKQWLPAYGRQPGGDSLYEFVDTTLNDRIMANVRKAVPQDLYNYTWPRIDYTPEDRKKGIRNPGYFREAHFSPSVGRTHWCEVHPEDPNKIYVVPDGGGIFKTDDGGYHWDCITDNIPSRADRSYSNGYAIPVDPDDWNHLFAFMLNSSVYETFDGGQTWARVPGATHKGFKRGYAFRDSKGNLKFIGCNPSTSWNSQIWISEDKGVNWTRVELPDSIKDIHPVTGYKGEWFQQVHFHPTNRDLLFLPTSRSIYYFDDGCESTIVNGKKTYNIKHLHMKVWNQDQSERRYPADYPDNDAIFPLKGTAAGEMVINYNKPEQMWYTAAWARNGQKQSAVYRTDDGGENWLTIHEPEAGIGSGFGFGEEPMGGWIGGFAVNLRDPNWVYGTTMRTSTSKNGGADFEIRTWYGSLPVKYENGKTVGVSASRHHSDNHFMRSHKSGRIFRGSDGGFLMNDDGFNWEYVGDKGMGQMLFYHIQVNEFGDQVMAGNTQDVDGQTYRYGRWGMWRGYEGSEGFINPYTSSVYFPNIGLVGWDPAHMSMDSWRNAVTRADVVSGSWYMSRTGMNGKSLLRVDDLGQTVVNLEQVMGVGIGGLVGKFGLCRDKGRTTIYCITTAHRVMRSLDGGKTFEQLRDNSGTDLKLTNTVLATDPNNSDIFYYAQSGKVYRYDVPSGTRTTLTTEGLPAGLGCNQLLFHEGSGDLYFHNTSTGFYLLEYDKATGTYANSWKYWMKGYNGCLTRHAEINYTTQEMVMCIWGRGVWVADLEHPSDRYFENGFALKECSYLDGRRTIGIDTEWTIPLYYYFKWTVNGEEITDCPYQYLRRKLNPGDRVQLELTLRESPDVHTTSAVYVIPEESAEAERPNEGDSQTPILTYDNPANKQPGRAMYSNGRGRVDLGYYDYFFNDFTIDMWIKPLSDGTILANRGRNGDAKGWYLYLDRNQLKFTYAPRNIFNQPRYEDAITQETTVAGGSLTYGEWSHIAVVHNRYGAITLYVNGVNVASGQRIIQDATLNNSCILSLFGDAIERYTIEATVDELKIWDHALTQNEVRQEMFSTNADDKDGLAAYFPFNAGSLDFDRETFSRHGMKSRVLAEVQYPAMSVATCARYASCLPLVQTDNVYKIGENNVLGIGATTLTGDLGLYVFKAEQWQNEEDNLDTDFFEYHPMGYLLHTFQGINVNEPIQLDFYPVEGNFKDNVDYRAYVADINSEKQVWSEIGNPEYDAAKGCLTLTGVKLQDLVDKKILFANAKPSIEVKVEGIGPDGVLNVYDESNTVYKLEATTLAGMPEPEKFYNILADGIVKPSGLYFQNGKATGELRLDLSKLGEFNTSVRTVLRSDDNPVKVEGDTTKLRPSMIPLNLEVRNRIAPRQIGTGLFMRKGHAKIGNPSNIQPLIGSKEVTMMGWVRIDSAIVLNHGGFNLITTQGTNGNVSGIRLSNGNLQYAQNGSLPWGLAGFPEMRITEQDLGKWIHFAVTRKPGKLRLYVNGAYRETSWSNSDPFSTVAAAAFTLGKNSEHTATNSAADIMCGAFDQVALWNRALEPTEIVKYMHSAVPMNDPGLIYYSNMDYTDESNVHRDIANLAEIKVYPTYVSGGEVSWGEQSPIPFDARGCVASTADDSPITLSYSGTPRTAYITTFRGTPYCYLNHDFQQYTALNQDFYGIIFGDRIKTAPAADQTVTLTYRHRSIQDGDHIAVAMRRTGTQDHLGGFIHASAVKAGEATFTIPASYLYESSEVMFFNYPSEEGGNASRPAMLQLSFGQAVTSRAEMQDDVPVLKLTADENTIPVLADVMSLARNYNNTVSIRVNETQYATPSQESIDFANTENQFNINIDRSKIDKFGLNDLTINLEGATANELKLKFYLEPQVQLTLVNGDEREVMNPGEDNADGNRGNTMRITKPIANLEIEAELIEGYLPPDEKVKLEVLTEMSNSINIGNGNLLNNESVTNDELEHHPSGEGAIHEGWNLIGNPYLTNINLTKQQNVKYDPNHVTKFFYQCDPVTGNYAVYDMTDYQASQQIHPFQSYFVQTMVEDAKFTVTPVAKEETPTKRTIEYNVTPRLRLELGLVSDDKLVDKVTFDYNLDYAYHYVKNEDAPKMFNLTGSSPEMFAVSGDGEKLALSATSAYTNYFDVQNCKGATSLQVLSSATLDPYFTIRITDHDTNHEWYPNSGDANTLAFDSGQRRVRALTDSGDERTTPGRFSVYLITKENPNTGASELKDNDYHVYVEDQQCIVTGLLGDGTVSIFTPAGQNIVNTASTVGEMSFNLSPGYYLVIIRENGKEFTSKIFVK